MTILGEDLLWVRFRSDDLEDSRAAREEIVLMYQDIVDAAAFKLKARVPPYVLVEDLLAYAQIGLLKAVDTYDESKGTFRGFAYMKAYGAIIDELRSQDWAPRGLRKDERTLNEAKAELATERPTVTQISDHLGWETARVESTLRRIQNSNHLSLDFTSENSQGESLHQQVELSAPMSDPEEEAQTSSLCEVFVETIETLSPDGQEVIARRYFLGQTLTEVAKDIDIPLTMVRRIHSEAVGAVLSRVTEAVVA